MGDYMRELTDPYWRHVEQTVVDIKHINDLLYVMKQRQEKAEKENKPEVLEAYKEVTDMLELLLVSKEM